MKQLDNQITHKASLFPMSTHATACVGSIGSGKTTLMLNLLLHGGWNRYYNRCIYISPTGSLDKKVDQLFKSEFLKTNVELEKIKEEERLSLMDEPDEPTKFEKFKTIDQSDIYSTYDHKVLDDLVDWQKYHKEEYGEDVYDKVLVILDDSIALGCYDLKRRNKLTLTITECRHINVSFCMLSQYFKSLPPVIRTCLTSIFFFQTNITEKDNIYHTFDMNGMEQNRWNELVSVITAKEHVSCQINKLNPKGYRMMKECSEFIA